MVRLTDRTNMTLDIYRGRKTTTQQQRQAYAIWNSYSKLHIQHGLYFICLYRTLYAVGRMEDASLTFCEAAIPNNKDFIQAST